MRPILSRDQMRAFDAHAIGAGVPGIVLMENAGRGAAHLIGLRARPSEASAVSRPRTQGPSRGTHGSCVRCADERSLSLLRFVIVCGAGNNGGDGFVVGRQLLGRGADVEVVLCVSSESLRGDARTAYNAYRAVGGSAGELDLSTLAGTLSQSDIVVDALLGTGVARDVTGDFARVVELINTSGRPVVALDIPSGLDADTGRVHGVAVRAAHTVTFAHLKSGLLTTSGFAQAGRLTVSHIGVPAALPPSIEPVAWLLDERDVAQGLSPREVKIHKVSAGRVGLVAGSPGTMGAARLAGLGALRSGAGLVTVLGNRETISKLESSSFELMTCAGDDWLAPPLHERLASSDALVVGPGLGRTDDARAAVHAALGCGTPLVLDADGLRAIETDPGQLRGRNGIVLTPHAGEAAGLLNRSSADVENDRFGSAAEIAKLTGAVVVLKGPRTIVAQSGRAPVVSAFGTAALATGGSGDVLAGMIGTALAQNVASEGAGDPFEAVWRAVSLHGLSAEAWSAQNGDAGLLASEVADGLPAVVERLCGTAD